MNNKDSLKDKLERLYSDYLNTLSAQRTHYFDQYRKLLHEAEIRTTNKTRRRLRQLSH